MQVEKSKNKILIVHNILWSHYTGNLFKEVYKKYFEGKEQLSMQVVHIANNMSNRKNIGESDNDAIHEYPFQVLFDKNIEDVGLLERSIALVKVFLKFRPTTTVVFGLNDPAYWILFVFVKMFSSKLVITANSTYYDQERIWYKELLKKYLLKMADQVLTYGNVHKEYLMSLGVPSDKINIRIQATDNNKIRSQFIDSNKDIGFNKFGRFHLFVGRLIPEKNVLFMLEAFSKSNSKHSLVIVGDGILYEEVLQYIKENKIKNVFLEGAKMLPDIISYYKYADSLVLPSVSETWGLVVNEAMLCELPVVVSIHCGCSKDLVKENENGFLFNPLELNQLIAIFDMMTYDFDFVKFGKLSLDIVSVYNLESASTQFYNGISKTF